MDSGDVMKERPILFSGAMVRAILAGQKTQTRRVVKPQPAPPPPNAPRAPMLQSWLEEIADGFVRCPYGASGDRLWVRETWNAMTPQGRFWDEMTPAERESATWALGIYKADETPGEWGHYEGRYVPSIHMPRRFSRLTLEVVGVRVERLAEITNGDAYAEGFGRNECAACNGTGYELLEGGPACGDCAGEGWHSESDNFRALWNSINAARGYGWEVNPWVWVVEFKRV